MGRKVRYISRISKIVLILFACGYMFMGCNEKEEESIYTKGQIESGKKISDYFSLVGEAKSAGVTVAGNPEIVLVYTQQVRGGGWVAWSGSNSTYLYTEENVGATAIRSKYSGVLFESGQLRAPAN